MLLDGGSLDEAERCFVEDLQLSVELGDVVAQASALNNLAITYRRLGRLDDAADCYRRSMALKRELGDRDGEVTALLNLCWLEHDRGDRDAARALLDAARTVARVFPSKHHRDRIRALELSLEAAASGGASGQA